MRWVTATFRKFMNATDKLKTKLGLVLKSLAGELKLSPAAAKYGYLLFNPKWWKKQMETWDWLYNEGYKSSMRSG